MAEVDHRNWSPETAEVWLKIIGYLDYDVALEAYRDASRNVTIEYVEPKHIVAHAQAVLHRRERLRARQQVSDDWHGDPKPENMDDYVQAYQMLYRAEKAGDVEEMTRWRHRVAVETGKYHDQLRREGIDPDHPRHYGS